MLTQSDARDAMGKTLYDDAGHKIGKIAQVYLDDTTGEPEFLTVNTGLLGGNESFVPAQQAAAHDDGLAVPFAKDMVKDAPNVAADGHLDPSAEQVLYDYYGLSHSTVTHVGDSTHDAGRDEVYDVDQDTRGRVDLAGTAGVEGHDTSGPTTDEAMTRSEEQLRVGTRTQAAGRARLRKYVTTEEQTITVPVRKEYAVLETEAITDENRGQAMGGGELTSDEHEILLNEEVVSVTKTVNPVERVRLGTETRTEEQTVTEEVRKENIEVDGDIERRP